MNQRTLLLFFSVLIALSSVSGVHAAEFKLTASDGAADDYFGWSVAIDGDYALVGAPGERGYYPDVPGSAYIFKRIKSFYFPAGKDFWIQQARLTASDGKAGDHFGWSVAIDGDYALVGNPGDDDKGADSGSAYIFKRNGIKWYEQQKLTASDGKAGDRFGFSVAIDVASDGEYALVGALRDDDKGSAYIFKWDGTSWTQQAKLTASDGAAYDRFGESVAIAGEYVLVGAPTDSFFSDPDPGSAYIYLLRGVEVPAVTFTGLAVLVGILSAIILTTIRRRR
jgi:hypothetical protein